MKKYLFFFAWLFCFTPWFSNAQPVIPNGDFEEWQEKAFKLPKHFTISNIEDTIYLTGEPNIIQVPSLFHGSYAVQLKTLGTSTDTLAAVLSNASEVNDPDPESWLGVIPCTEAPSGISGYYSYNVSDNSDSAIVAVQFRKNSANIGTYIFYLGGDHSDPTPFYFTFSPALSETPDSMLLIFVSSDLLHSEEGKPGSSLMLDSISLIGISTQPSLLNGDFEEWTEFTTRPILTDWYTDFENVSRTTDAKSGMFALELITMEDENNGNFTLSPGYISNGTWNNFTQNWEGGFPCEIQRDTFMFWYKYLPANPDDRARVNIECKKNGVIIGGHGVSLHASSEYTLVEIPIDLGDQISDSIVIFAASSEWQSDEWADTAESYVGAVLTLDGLTFKSAVSTYLEKEKWGRSILFYPNPMNETGIFELSSEMDLKGLQIALYNVSGTLVRKISVVTPKVTLDKKDFAPGVYFYKFLQNGNVLTTGKIVME